MAFTGPDYKSQNAVRQQAEIFSKAPAHGAVGRAKEAVHFGTSSPQVATPGVGGGSKGQLAAQPRLLSTSRFSWPMSRPVAAASPSPGLFPLVPRLSHGCPTRK